MDINELQKQLKDLEHTVNKLSTALIIVSITLLIHVLCS